jgi:hypothetical protein
MHEPLNGAAPPGATPLAVVANGHDPTPPARPKRRPLDAALIAEAKRLVETTALPQRAIAARLGLKAQQVSELKIAGGWQRPPGAPRAPQVLRAGILPAARTAVVAAKRDQLVARLYHACDRQLAVVERKLKQRGDDMEEKDVRALGHLAKTLGTLMALERDDGAKTSDAEPVDRDQLNADLARRIARWAEGREGSE